MGSLDLLSRLGVYLSRDFLPEILCEALQRQLSETAGTLAEEVYSEDVRRVNPDVRRTQEVEVADDLRLEVAARLDAIRPALAAHFNVPLEGSEGVAFLVYERGGFYRPHRDRARRDPAAGGNETYRRRVSAVVFLNQPAEIEPPAALEYTGGRLTLYGLVDDDRWRDVGFPIDGEAGLLVAFDSSVIHEVTPVSAGRRMTAVDWFY
jgi:predicted 2-oxoglutarate/Fe(II)-dependent dioxygenase YbiX